MRNHLKGYLPDAAIYVAPVLLIFSISLQMESMGKAIFYFGINQVESVQMKYHFLLPKSFFTEQFIEIGDYFVEQT